MGQSTSVESAAKRSRARPNCMRERRLWQSGFRVVAGVDEVGRGPLAGPVTAAAVVIRPTSNPSWLRNVRDSKQLTAAARHCLATEIWVSSESFGIGWASAGEIDDVGIVAATARAMSRALLQLSPAPEFVLIDGDRLLVRNHPAEAIVRGDESVASIAAASILAKVARDTWMEQLAERFDGYGFAANKGYGTAAHLSALAELGPTPQHRRTFAPLRQQLALLPAG